MRKILKMIGIGIGILIIANFVIAKLAQEVSYWMWYYSTFC